MKDKIKLFETVLGIHEKGAASLTSSERTLIEQETRALLNAASRRQATKAPEGFDSFLADLQTAENADEAYAMILKFLKEDDKGDAGKPDMPKMPPMPPMEGEEGEEEEKEEKVIDKLEKGVEELEELEEEDEGEESKEEKSEKKDDKPKDKEDKKDDKKPDLDKDKKELMAKIKRAEEEEKKDKKDEKDEKKEDKKDEEKKEASHLIPKMPSTASKVKVRVTSNKNLLVYFDGKPLFHAVPSHKVKRDTNALKRLANKVYGWVVYEGVNYALKKCGAKLLAGVDSDIEVAFEKDIPAASEGVTESEDDVVKDAPETPDDDVRDEAEFDTQETHDKVQAGVDDGGEVVTEEKPDATPAKVTDEDVDVIEEVVDTPDNDVRDEADVDFKNVEANYRKLYASRAKKAAKEANEAFVKRFIRAVKIAARRMELNYEAHPYKAASLDVLVEAGIYSDEAQELTEKIASEGHAEFVAHLLESTASLMKKSDEYLKDLESDLKDLQHKAVKVAKTQPKRSMKSERLRKSAEAGNFALTNVGAPVTRSKKNDIVGGIRSAVGDTHISRLASVISGQ